MNHAAFFVKMPLNSLLYRIQVWFNSGIATILSVAVWTFLGWEDKCLDTKESTVITSLVGGIIGHYCCCNGDTWSSELGVLSDAQPRLITTLKVGILCAIIPRSSEMVLLN